MIATRAMSPYCVVMKSPYLDQDLGFGKAVDDFAVKQLIAEAAVAALMTDKLDTGDIHARKAYLSAIVSRIEVCDKDTHIIGEKTSLEKAVGTTLTGQIPVSGLVRKWCTQLDSNQWPPD